MAKTVGALLALYLSMLCIAPASAHPTHSAQVERAAAIKDRAVTFLNTLSADQRASIVSPFEDDGARTNWSNLPSVLFKHRGVALAEMTPAQRAAFHGLLEASLSSQGYGKAAIIMWFEDILREEETERVKTATIPAERRRFVNDLIQSRQSDNYWVTIFGEPGAARWGWMVSGHHLAANFTVVGGQIAFTPLFLGVEPQIVGAGRYAGWRVLGHEIQRGFELLRTLDESQRRVAKISDEVTADLFTGKGRKNSLQAPVGIPASRFNNQQQEKLWGLLREFIGSAPDEAADAQLHSIRQDGLEKLHFAWWGNAEDPSKRFMYRIHGPSILIEYVREARGGSPANHVHAIVRDPRNDYGEDWLSKHYNEQPHP